LLCSYNEGQAVDLSTLGKIVEPVRKFIISSIYGEIKTTGDLLNDSDAEIFVSGENLSRKTCMLEPITASENEIEEFFSNTWFTPQTPYDYFQIEPYYVHPFSWDAIRGSTKNNTYPVLGEAQSPDFFYNQFSVVGSRYPGYVKIYDGSRGLIRILHPPDLS
jgi:hypothetical protein